MLLAEGHDGFLVLYLLRYVPKGLNSVVVSVGDCHNQWWPYNYIVNSPSNEKMSQAMGIKMQHLRMLHM
jgi:hypothetical protein